MTDLEEDLEIFAQHVSEAISYRHWAKATFFLHLIELAKTDYELAVKCLAPRGKHVDHE